MNLYTNKKRFTFLLIFILFFKFLPSNAESNFKSPVLNSTDLAFNGPINAIVKDEMTGIVYVGGRFTSIDNEPRSNFASFSIPGN